MRMSRRKGNSIIWPGFVDAVTTLLMVLIFLLTIFTVMQSVLQDMIVSQDGELDDLSVQVSELSNALGVEREETQKLEEQTNTQNELIATLRVDLGKSNESLAESQAQAEGLSVELQKLEELQARLLLEKGALEASLLATRDDLEKNAGQLATETEKRKALDLLVGKLQNQAQQNETALTQKTQALDDEQKKLANASRSLALMNAQLSALRSQLADLQAILDDAKKREASSNIQVESLGKELNTALAQLAAEQKRRAGLEEEKRIALEAENRNLEKFKSDFLGQLRGVLEGREGIQVVGDRFVFSSEVLFDQASATLLPEGKAQIARVVGILNDVRENIPPEIEWIIRVDGHTDNLPLSGGGVFADNWELSQARALSVVRYMQNELGFPPEHLAAAGFGEYRPVALGDDERARAQNRRIELKLTER